MEGKNKTKQALLFIASAQINSLFWNYYTIFIFTYYMTTSSYKRGNSNNSNNSRGHFCNVFWTQDVFKADSTTLTSVII